MFKMLKDLLNHGIKPAIEAQSHALEKMVMQELIATQSTITTNQDRIYQDLRQDNLRLQNQVVDLTRELRSTIAATTPLTWIPTQTTASAPEASDLRGATVAAEGQVPR